MPPIVIGKTLKPDAKIPTSETPVQRGNRNPECPNPQNFPPCGAEAATRAVKIVRAGVFTVVHLVATPFRITTRCEPSMRTHSNPPRTQYKPTHGRSVEPHQPRTSDQALQHISCSAHEARSRSVHSTLEQCCASQCCHSIFPNPPPTRRIVRHLPTHEQPCFASSSGYFQHGAH